jgi:hypothetical protein
MLKLPFCLCLETTTPGQLTSRALLLHTSTIRSTTSKMPGLTGSQRMLWHSSTSTDTTQCRSNSETARRCHVVQDLLLTTRKSATRSTGGFLVKDPILAINSPGLPSSLSRLRQKVVLQFLLRTLTQMPNSTSGAFVTERYSRDSKTLSDLLFKATPTVRTSRLP